MQAPAARTIAEFLTQHFGERSAFIEGFDHPQLGGSLFTGAEFTISQYGVNGSCGGPCLISFAPPSTSFVQAYIRTPRPIYLVFDDSEGQSWSARRARGETGHTYRPNAKLRLVQSG